MATRFNLVPGDIFEVPVGSKRYFVQYLINDHNLFDANVIRAFEYHLDNEFSEVDISVLEKSKTKFNTHTFIKGGVKFNHWRKVANVPLKDFSPPQFRATNDTYAEVKKSSDWYIWRVGEEPLKIGQLGEKHRELDYGSVFSPADIGEWLDTGYNHFMFPD